MARLLAPALALGAWALAALLGADPGVLRWAGPALTACACLLHGLEEYRLIRDRHR